MKRTREQLIALIEANSAARRNPFDEATKKSMLADMLAQQENRGSIARASKQRIKFASA